MAQAKRDDNRVTTLLGVSSSDSTTPVVIEADATTKRLLVNSAVVSIIPGTDATNLGKAVDNIAGATDTGIAMLAVRDDSLTTLTPVDGDYVNLRVNSTGALHVTGGGGGTEYNEDDATPNPIVGTATLMERDDVLSAVTPAEGDFIAFRGTAEGALWVQDFNSDAIKTAVEIIDNIVQVEDETHSTGDSGVMMLGVENEDQAALTAGDKDYTPIAVTPEGNVIVKQEGNITVNSHDVTNSGTFAVQSTLQTGSNAIGTLAANSGVDIGDVDVTSITGVTFSNAAMQITGDEAHDAVDAGNPVKIGGRAQEPTAALEEVADNDRVDGSFDRQGRVAMWLGYPVQSADINDSTSGNNTIQAAAGAGLRIAVMGYHIVSDGTTDIRWEDGAGGTAFTGQIPLQAREGLSVGYGTQPMWVGSADTLLNLELTANVNVHGQVSFVVMTD